MKHPFRKKSLPYEPSQQNPRSLDDINTRHDDLNAGYDIALTFIQARMNAGLTQEELARRLGTTQSVIVRLESGQCLPSHKTICRLAKATGTLLCKKLDH